MKRFSELICEGNQKFYHGTISDFLPKIKSKGLIPGKDNLIWVTKDRQTAILNGAMRTYYANKKINSKLVLLEVSVAENKLTFSGSKDATLSQVIPPNQIKVLNLTADEKEEFESRKAGIIRRKDF